MTTSYPDLPQRMYRRNRPIDPLFEPQESLYRRYEESELLQGNLENGLNPLKVKYKPDFSVNRGKYSEPGDVLLSSTLACGIVVVKVQEIPEVIESGDGRQFHFHPTHAPYEENYAHSEIRTFNNGNHDKAMKVPQKVSKEFKTAFCMRAQIIRLPNAAS